MKRLISGIKPTGELTLGNYIGAIKQFVELQNTLSDYEILFFVADLHALTTPQNKLELRKRIKCLAAMYIACGLDPDKVILFVQSEVMEHAMLSYIMESTAYIGEMERMTQFKDAKAKKNEGIRTSLLTYPCLMAADILLYDANLVPIGDDQIQHLELTRELANRFNHQYGETFVVPEGLTVKVGSRIMSLTEPTKKMSKSEDTSAKSYILLQDDLKVIRNKVLSAVTDSDTKVLYDVVNKPGISNLLTIYSSLIGKTIKELEATYQGKSYADFKTDLAEVVVDTIKPIQARYQAIINSKELDDILDQGAAKASFIAKRKMAKVVHKLGIGRKLS